MLKTKTDPQKNSPTLDEINAEWIIAKAISQNQCGPIRHVITLSLSATVDTESGSVTINREVVIEPEEMLELLNRRKQK